MRFVVLIEYTDMAARERALPQHRASLQQGRATGSVIESGPFADGKGGMYILECRDEAYARSIVDADPYTKAALNLTLRAWRPSREPDKAP